MSESLPRSLSAKYTGDFAYPTVKDRIPVILTKVVDYVYRLKSDAVVDGSDGEVDKEDLKQICGALSKLKNEIQTDKPLSRVCDDREDSSDWNCHLAEVTESQGGVPASWFKSSWLYTECYFYRRVVEAVLLSSKMKDFDPFGASKRTALTSSLEAVRMLGEVLHRITQSTDVDLKEEKLRTHFIQFLQVSLWGNKCDLSISAGLENSQTENPLAQLDSLQQNIISDSSNKVWSHVNNLRNNSGGRIDIVLDNAGFELYTDLCFAEFLTSKGFAKQVVFHGKDIPWFVSDVTRKDFDWTLQQLQQEPEPIRSLGNRWKENIETGRWVYTRHKFWTLPQDFAAMKLLAPDLYSELSKSDFVFFKGDLNYRKLTGDLKWEHTVPFSQALRGFKPAPLCTLRTLKCDLVVGLEPGVAEATEAKDKNWLITGNWAVIQVGEPQNV